MANPTENLIVNGTFGAVVPGTASGVIRDRGNPASWTTSESRSDQVQVNGALMFNRNDAPAGGSIYQDIAGVAATGEPITVKFNYFEAGGGSPTTNSSVRVLVYDRSNSDAVVLDRTVTTNGDYEFSFPADGTTYRIQFIDTSRGTLDRDPYIDNVTFVAPVPRMDCFTAGTLIKTPNGQRDIATLKAGDLVETRDHGAQPILWIKQRMARFANTSPDNKLRPIRVAAGALGENLPETDLLVSQQHRIMLKSKIAFRMFGIDEVLTAAKNLVDRPGIAVDQDTDQVTYIHMLLANHELVLADGCWAETLYLGGQAISSLDEAQRDEIKALFPEVLSDDFTMPAARQLVNGASVRNFLARVEKNNKTLVEA